MLLSSMIQEIKETCQAEAGAELASTEDLPVFAKLVRCALWCDPDVARQLRPLAHQLRYLRPGLDGTSPSEKTQSTLRSNMSPPLFHIQWFCSDIDVKAQRTGEISGSHSASQERSP